MASERKRSWLLDPETWASATNNPVAKTVAAKEWLEINSNPEVRRRVTLWASNSGTSERDKWFDVMRKLVETRNHAAEVLGEDSELSPPEMITPVKFIIKTFERSLEIDPFAVRDVALEDGATIASAERMMEVDRFFEFADSAYEALEGETLHEFLLRRGFELLYHDNMNDCEMAAHYVALEPKEKLAVIAIKGTSTVGDMLTDLLCRSAEFSHVNGADKPSYAHEGIMNASRRLVARLHAVMKHMLQPLGYRVVLTGHSLGAAVSALVAFILRKELGFTNVTAMAYASPPVLDKDSALSARDFVTTVVNDRDFITRQSLSNMRVMHKIILRVNDLLKAGTITDKAITEGAGSQSERLVDLLREAQEAGRLGYEQDLFVPGRVVYMIRNGNGKYDAVEGDGQLTGLRQLMPTRNMLTDHSIVNYRAALEELMFCNYHHHSEGSPVLVQGTLGTRITVQLWRKFTSPFESKKVTFYKVVLEALTEGGHAGVAASASEAVGRLVGTVAAHLGPANATSDAVSTRHVSTFSAWRRFSDFHALDSRLNELGLETPSLPNTITVRSPEERRPLLAGFLQSCLVRAARKEHSEALAELRAFVGAGGRPPAPEWLAEQLDGPEGTLRSPSSANSCAQEGAGDSGDEGGNYDWSAATSNPMEKLEQARKSLLRTWRS